MAFAPEIVPACVGPQAFACGAVVGGVIIGVGAYYGVKWLRNHVFSESTEEDTSSGESGSAKTDEGRVRDRPSNASNPASALDSIEKEKKGKDRSRPSTEDPEGEWDGAKKRPSSSPIDSTRKSRDRARDRNYLDDWETENMEDIDDREMGGT